ncbi:hypothetical protein LCGC14_2304850, partial [marine sediment metagenome]
TGGEDLLFLRDQINTADLTIDSPTGALMEIRAGVGDHLQLSSGATANQGIRIRNDGNVGIGTTTPAHKLHVIGNVNITGSFNATRIEGNIILQDGNQVNDSIDLSLYSFDTWNRSSPTQIINSKAGVHVAIGVTGSADVVSAPILHVFAGESGLGNPSGLASEFLIEDDDDVGMTFQMPDNKEGSIVWASPSDTVAAQISWGFDQNDFEFRTLRTGATMSFATSLGKEAIAIDAGQKVSLSGELTVNNISTHSGKLSLIGSNFLQAGGDSSNVYTPTNVGGVEIGVNVGGTTYDRPIKVVDNYAYVMSFSSGAGDTDPEFRIYDVSEDNPILVGGADFNGDGYVLDVQGDYAYMSSNTGDKFRVYDISDKSNPVKVGGLDEGIIIQSIFVQGSYAYIGTISGDEFRVYDISDPANPTNIGSYNDATDGEDVNSVFVQGKYAYAVTDTTASGNDDFYILDISDPTNPTKVGGIDLEGNGYTVRVQSGKAYVSGSATFGLQIYNVTNVSNPAFISSINLGAFGYSMGMAGKYVYIWGGAGVEVIDISDSSNPVKVGQGESTNDFYGVAIKGNRLYLG